MGYAFNPLPKIKMILEVDAIVVFGDSSIRITNEEDALKIQLPKQEPSLSGFELDGVNALEVVELLVELYLGDYTNPFVAPILGKMNFFLGMGLGQRQQRLPTLP